MSAILIVDDDSAVRVLLRAICRRQGFEVVEAENGAQALAAIEKRRFDVVVLDLMMPIMSGGEVLNRLAETNPWRRNVIVLTAASPAFTDRLNHQCVHSVLRKPFDLDGFTAALADAARREVLVVEDDPAHQYLIERELTRAGYSVKVAQTGTTALQELTQRGFDAMVLDINLPEVSGYDVMNAVQSMPGAMPVVVLTVLEQLERDLAADAILRKSAGFEELVPTLRSVIG
jgi:CheY-like chemotaxis protein